MRMFKDKYLPVRAKPIFWVGGTIPPELFDPLKCHLGPIEDYSKPANKPLRQSIGSACRQAGSLEKQ
jgi:hypothetical protein